MAAQSDSWKERNNVYLKRNGFRFFFLYAAVEEKHRKIRAECGFNSCQLKHKMMTTIG